MRRKSVDLTAFAGSGNLHTNQDGVLGRLRSGIAEASLECGSREVVNAMLDQVGIEEHLIRRADGLADARKMRDAIIVVLVLLGELDDLTPDEPDRTAFHEIAGLFQDVADFAAFGAGAAMRAAGHGNG